MSQSFNQEVIEGETLYSFPEASKNSHCVSLRSVIRNFTSNPGLKGVPAAILYNVLGRLRSLLFFLDQYNKEIGSEDQYYIRYIQNYTLQLLSGFGFQISKADEKVSVPGLADLIQAIEKVFHGAIQEARQAIAQNIVTFEALQELYLPGSVVAGMTSCGVYSGFRVIHCFYEERRSLRGMEKSFHLQLEYLTTVGRQFAMVTFEEVMSGWMGTRARSISELPYYPASKTQLEAFKDRGSTYASIVSDIKGFTYMSYEGGSFFMHGGVGNANRSMSGSLTHSGGRIVIDSVQGSVLGHYPSNAVDEPSNAMINLIGRYRRSINNSETGKGGSISDGFVLFDKVPQQLEHITWPAIVGFSFALKAWGHVLLSGLKEIKFNDKAFDELVLDADRKILIKALVRFGGGTDARLDDIISGKSNGSIFLLHGPPGVGKTLTAEAIAEVLHRPLYYISMGELGTVPETVENRLRDVLSLCEGWNALALIDEADVFLEKRQISDFVRNAMVCVMLRLVEYHPGILFLTTNRVKEFDPAFESRVTVALKYDSLSKEARAQVWKTLIARIPSHIVRVDHESINYAKLAEHDFNGRQINNAVRLALALTLDSSNNSKNGSALLFSQPVIENTIKIMETGRNEMKSDSEF